MKRFRLWIKELSLSQQLLAIVFIVISVFSVFFFVFLTSSIDEFVSREMFKVLDSSQQSMIYYLDKDGDDLKLPDYSNANIIHCIYDKNDSSYEVLGGYNVEPDLIDNATKNISTSVITMPNHFSYIKEGQNILYAIVPLSPNKCLISFISDSYRSDFKDALVNSVINMNMMIVALLFFVLTLWVTSLIHPLNQIRNYIDKIRKDEPATLKIERRDEIGEVAKALVDMEDELQKQTRIKEEMIQNISHDLKTPIATIKSYSESIKDGIYPYETLEKSVDVIIEHANRLEKKVHSLILLNKMGYLQDQCEEGDNLNMKDIIQKTILSLSVIKPNIEFRQNLENEFFHGEEEPWRIVVENLLDNALRYAKTYIEIDLKPSELRVINDGKQISPDRLEKLFKPYEKGSDGQFGLGLSIVYRVVTTYGYHIEAENLTDGVCFRVWKTIPKAIGMKKEKG